MQNIFSKIQEFFLNSVVNVWKGLSSIQRIIAVGVVVVLFGGIVMMSIFAGRPSKVALFTNPVTDPGLLTQISNKLDVENIAYTTDNSGIIFLKDKKTAIYARSLLVQEDLMPGDTDPWELFDTQRWTQTDFERNINLQRSITKQLEQLLEALDDVDSAKVTLVMPEDTLFSADRNPVTASVILRFKPGSDFPENRKKVEGVERLIMFAVEGLTEENLVVSDVNGIRLNDFTNLADFDSLEQTKQEIKIKNEYEEQYKASILKALGDIYSPDRVRIVNIDIEIDFSKKKEESVENFPIVVTEDNPNTPFDETEVVLAVPRSQENIEERYSGSGFNPQGPPGVEGQTPPSYKDLDGIVGSWDHTSEKVNNEINQKKITTEKRPTISRVSASVAIDGLWERKYNETTGALEVSLSNQIERLYIPLTKAELDQALSLVESAVGYSQARGDSVSVENVKFDRSAQFAQENQNYFQQFIRRRVITFLSLGIIGLILIIFFVRVMLRQLERARWRREERIAEQYRRQRELQIMEMSQDEDDVEEETELQRLTNDVIEVVNKNPEEVSILIKSWMEV